MKILVDPKEDSNMIIYFDGSRCEESEGAGVVFVTPQGSPYVTPSKLIFHVQTTLSMKP